MPDSRPSTPQSARDRGMLDALDALLDHHHYSFDDFLTALADDMRRYHEDTHPLVKSCLEAAAEHLEHASMDWYCSTK